MTYREVKPESHERQTKNRRKTHVADWEPLEELEIDDPAPEPEPEPEVGVAAGVVVACPTLTPFGPTETTTPFEVVRTPVVPVIVVSPIPIPSLPMEISTPSVKVVRLDIMLASAAAILSKSASSAEHAL